MQIIYECNYVRRTRERARALDGARDGAGTRRGKRDGRVGGERPEAERRERRVLEHVAVARDDEHREVVDDGEREELRLLAVVEVAVDGRAQAAQVHLLQQQLRVAHCEQQLLRHLLLLLLEQLLHLALTDRLGQCCILYRQGAIGLKFKESIPVNTSASINPNLKRYTK